MPVLISDLWVPAIWIKATRERQATFPSLFNSGVVTQTEQFNEFASGAGTSVNMPFFKDITDQSDEIQVENTPPTTDNGQPSGLMVAPILNRVTKNSAGALAGQVAGDDPVAAMSDAVVARRLKQRQKTLLAMMRGCFGTGSTAANAAAALSAVRYGGTTSEIFLETTAGQTAANKMSPDVFIDACALMGELSDDLKRGVFWCHPNVKATLMKLDALNFKTGKPSDLPFEITTYRDVPMFTSETLMRAGTTSGSVYDSYLIARGSIAYGDKPQSDRVGDVAHLYLDDTDADKNNVYLYDRTRFLMLLNGMKWVGAAAGQSATNAELQTVANWNLVYQTANRVGAVAIRSNG